MIHQGWLDEAALRLKDHVLLTSVSYDPANRLWLKWENQQRTGSFKIRGAFNRILSLSEDEIREGIVTASAGNHGLGVALAAQARSAQATVFVSTHAVETKLIAIRNLGAQLEPVSGSYDAVEQLAIDFAKRTGAAWVSPYNDAMVIAGQGTMGLEMIEQIPGNDFQVCYVPAGGGGLVCGIGLAMQRLEPRPKVVAVQSEASAYLHQLFFSGSQEGVMERESLADGLAGGVEPASMTIGLMRQVVDDFVLVTEEEIARAIAFAWWKFNERIEGSAAVALAGALNHRLVDGKAAVIISGGNIQPEIHRQILTDWPEEKL